MDRPPEPEISSSGLARPFASPHERSRTQSPSVFGGRGPVESVRSNVLRASWLLSMAGTPYIAKELEVKKESGGTSTSRSGYRYTASRARERTTAEERERALDQCVQRLRPGRTREALREFIGALLEQNAIPLSLLEDVPVNPEAAGKTSFDQIYDACMFLAFPNYRPIVRRKAFGPEAPEDLKLWRAMFPRELGVTHVIVRARSFQEAFALSCDYACRMTLRESRRISADMTIRVQFLGDKAASRMVSVRHAVRDRMRKVSNLKGREYSLRDVAGATLVAIGSKNGRYSIFKYVESEELRAILEKSGLRRTSAVDIETFLPGEPPPAEG